LNKQYEFKLKFNQAIKFNSRTYHKSKITHNFRQCLRIEDYIDDDALRKRNED